MADWLVVGLGNPGAEYAGSRHNAGADVVALLADRHGGKLKHAKRERALVDDVRIGAARVALAFPQTYMNDSGISVAALVRRYDIDDPTRIVIVQDELDLPHARVRVKEGGGLAGHNGLRSIKQHLKTDAFLRVRIGIGKPPGGKEQGADHVLKRPAKRDREELAIALEEAADAVELILAEGVGSAMNQYNSSGTA
jgi:PTH1 family peptidyl-tRNA hydrolase